MLGRALSSVVGVILSVCATLVGISAAGASECSLPAMRIAERPGFGGPPTEVAIGLIVGDLLNVDDVNQQMTADLFATLEWSDPRLDGLDGCSFQRARVWTPPITLFNSAVLSGERTQARDQVSVGADGRVRYSQRYRGEISTYHALHRFPFDQQSFAILVGSLGEGPSELLLRTLPEKVSARAAPGTSKDGGSPAMRWTLKSRSYQRSMRTAACSRRQSAPNVCRGSTCSGSFCHCSSSSPCPELSSGCRRTNTNSALVSAPLRC